jgi:hypothetical protein
VRPEGPLWATCGARSEGGFRATSLGDEPEAALYRVRGWMVGIARCGCWTLQRSWPLAASRASRPTHSGTRLASRSSPSSAVGRAHFLRRRLPDNLRNQPADFVRLARLRSCSCLLRRLLGRPACRGSAAQREGRSRVGHRITDDISRRPKWGNSGRSEGRVTFGLIVEARVPPRSGALRRRLKGHVSAGLELVPPFVRSASAPPASCTPARAKGIVGVAAGIPARPEPSGSLDRPDDRGEMVHATDPVCGRQTAGKHRHCQIEPGARASTGMAGRPRRPPGRGPILFNHTPRIADQKSRGAGPRADSCPFESHRGCPNRPLRTTFRPRRSEGGFGASGASGQTAR